MKHGFSILFVAAALAFGSPVHAESNDAMAERGLSLLESAATVVEGDQGHCDKMGDDLSGFIDTRSGDIAALRSWGMGLSRAEQRALAAKYQARFRVAEGRLRAGITPCAANARVRAALGKVGIGG